MNNSYSRHRKAPQGTHRVFNTVFGHFSSDIPEAKRCLLCDKFISDDRKSTKYCSKLCSYRFRKGYRKDDVIPKCGSWNRKITAEMILKFKLLYQYGFTYKQIAKEFKLNHVVVKKYIHDIAY